MTDQEVIQKLAFSLLGVPYKFGGRNRIEGFDCSQSVIELKIAEGKLPHGYDSTAQGLFNKFGPLKNGAPEFGDLAFFGINKTNITHVGFVLTKSFMFEMGGGDSKTVTLKDAIEKGACGRIRPMKYRKDFLGCTPG